jgi:micrococcal nuclease
VRSTVRSLRPSQAWFSRLLLVPVLAALAAGCSEEQEARPSFESGYARVTKVTDGDTIHAGDHGSVRLIGIDTPEVYGEPECFGRQASRFAKRLLPLGTRVRFRVGVEERDRYGRLLAYMWLPDGRMLNRVMIDEGYAQPLTIPPNVEFADVFRAGAHAARQAGLGLWQACGATG